jgi:hypothetical protein
MIALGHTNSEIADELYLSVRKRGDPSCPHPTEATARLEIRARALRARSQADPGRGLKHRLLRRPRRGHDQNGPLRVVHDGAETLRSSPDCTAVRPRAPITMRRASVSSATSRIVCQALALSRSRRSSTVSPLERANSTPSCAIERARSPARRLSSSIGGPGSRPASLSESASTATGDSQTCNRITISLARVA